jgi:hypothetical protein
MVREASKIKEARFLSIIADARTAPCKLSPFKRQKDADDESTAIGQGSAVDLIRY